MHSAVQAALADAHIEDLWREQGARVELESRADFTRFVAQEITDWSRIARAANLQLD
jgi:tripartite-type tricarboxylate transporter receptor subunit TctC